MEQALLEFFNKFPMALKIYTGLTGAYTIFCVIASFTKTNKDDDIANSSWLRRFFSLPPKAVK